jgi:hypothetical protein
MATAIFSSGKMKTPQTHSTRTIQNLMSTLSPPKWLCVALFCIYSRVGLMLVAGLIVPFFEVLPSGKAVAGDPDLETTVFSCQFQRSQDKNADRQPDAWRRRRDREHPSFIQAEITSRDPLAFKKAKETEAALVKIHHALQTGEWNPDYVPEVTPPQLTALMDSSLLNECYEVRIDGGAFETVSPRFDIDTRYDYVLEAEIECQRLVHHQATVELRLINSKGNIIDTYSTRPVSGARPWNSLRTTNISVSERGKVRGEISIRVQPTDSKFGRGTARFDNIRLRRMPTLTIKSNMANNISTPGSVIEFTCFAAGLSAEKNDIELNITDIDGQEVLRQSLPLVEHNDSAVPSGKFVSQENRPSVSAPEGKTDGKSFAVFPVQLKQPGLYYVQAQLGNSKRQILVAVLEATTAQKSPYGISLESVPHADQIPNLLKLIQLSQTSWVKLPIWFDSDDIDSGKSTNMLARGLKQAGITTVGRLDRPPASQYAHFDEDPSRTQSVSHLQDPKIWEPLLDPILSEINTYIDYLQLGSDTDNGYIGSSNSSAILEKIRTVMQYYFQDPKLVVASDWLLQNLNVESETINLPYNAMHYSTRPQLTSRELTRYATVQQKQRLKLWTSIDPLPKSSYPIEDRVIDLLEKMIAVKQTGIQAAFATAPFDEETGLLDDQLFPSEMLVPWARIVTAIGHRTPVGAVGLQQGSQNVTFQGQDGDVMILWNSRPVVEELFFSNEISASDIWGRPVKVEQVSLKNGGKTQRIPVGKWPVLVEGVDGNVVRWRQEFQLLVDHLNSHLSNENDLPIRLQNTLPKRAKGSLLLSSPSLLKAGQRRIALDIEAGRMENISIPLEFRSDASAGLHTLEFQFQIKADKDYLFSESRNLMLGHKDIQFRWDLLRLDDEFVEARVELTNKTTQNIDFDCTLFPPNQPYIRVSLTNNSPGTNAALYRWRIPKSVEGKNGPIWIRCEQIRSPLTLNYLVQEQ